jgi:hypothetical protein
VLIDCTYKTNKFRMPLLNICAVTPNKKMLQISLCFLSSEKEVDYECAIAWFYELMQNEQIEEPLCFVTDRELALMNALDTTFPNSAHLLCTWHVNMNILANCRKHFAKDKADPNKPSNFIPDPGWEPFLKDWASVLDSSTEAEYTSRLTLFRKHSKVATVLVVVSQKVQCDSV